MVHVLVKHKVKDYNKWKSVFDKNSELRKAGGEKGVRLFHNIDKPNDTVIILEWDNIENARKFYESEELKKSMKEGGVVMKPYIYYLEEVEDVGSSTAEEKIEEEKIEEDEGEDI